MVDWLDPLLPWIYAFTAIALWTLGIYVLNRRGTLAKYNLVPMGPLLMVKTVRGRDFIDRSARFRRTWRVFGDLSIVIVALTMIGITALLVWEATLVRLIPRDRAPSPELLLGIPGLNPIIPLWYGILALAIAVGLHELMHGILSRVANVKVESLGLLFLIFPIGAFVEPAEAELKALPRRERARIYAVGASINMLLAVLFGVLFSTMMLSVQPAQPGVGVAAYSIANSPAEVAGILVGSILTHVAAAPIVTSADLREALDAFAPGDATVVTWWKDGASQTAPVRLGDDGTGRPILGIRAIETRTSIYHPFTDLEANGGFAGALLLFISLPFAGYSPLQAPITDFYVITGPWASVPAPVFYVLANILYWLFWINLMLGATNALPAVPLDGGYVFKDGIEALLLRVRGGLEPSRREAIVRRVSHAFAFLILALILWQIIGPRL